MVANSSAGSSKSPPKESSSNSPENLASLASADSERDPQGLTPAYSGNVRSLRYTEAGISTSGVRYRTEGYGAAADRRLAVRPK
jgi:hypothetical protein